MPCLKKASRFRTCVTMRASVSWVKACARHQPTNGTLVHSGFAASAIRRTRRRFEPVTCEIYPTLVWMANKRSVSAIPDQTGLQFCRFFLCLSFRENRAGLPSSRARATGTIKLTGARAVFCSRLQQ
jgi:hypothetical protein